MRLAAIIAALVALTAGVAIAVPGGGDDAAGGGGSALTWAANPVTVRPPELPDDRVVGGRLRNAGESELRLDVRDARLLDAEGRTVRGTIRFAESFGHGLYSPRRQPLEGEPELERMRLGELALVAPGASAPVTVSWRLGAGAAAPVRLAVAGRSVALPAAP